MSLYEISRNKNTNTHHHHHQIFLYLEKKYPFWHKRRRDLQI